MEPNKVIAKSFVCEKGNFQYCSESAAHWITNTTPGYFDSYSCETLPLTEKGTTRALFVVCSGAAKQPKEQVNDDKKDAAQELLDFLRDPC